MSSPCCSPTAHEDEGLITPATPLVAADVEGAPEASYPGAKRVSGCRPQLLDAGPRCRASSRGITVRNRLSAFHAREQIQRRWGVRHAPASHVRFAALAVSERMIAMATERDSLPARCLPLTRKHSPVPSVVAGRRSTRELQQHSRIGSGRLPTAARRGRRHS